MSTHAEKREARLVRAQAMADLFRSGMTLAAIGEMHGITRERVRQLVEEVGVTRCEGGLSKLKAERDAAATARRDARCIQKHGMAVAEYFATPASARKAFMQQKGNAGQRGIEWRMTFAEWWEIWQKSGKWADRGRGNGYVMARKGDAGPYAVGNVYICSSAQNASDQYIWKPWHARERSAKWRVYEHAGKRMTIGGWADYCGISANTIYNRLMRGWSFEDAVTRPVKAAQAA